MVTFLYATVEYCLAAAALMLPTTFQWTLWSDPNIPKNLFRDFRGISLYLADIPLILVIVLFSILVITHEETRRNTRKTISRAIERSGAGWWIMLAGIALLSISWTTVPQISTYGFIRLLGGLTIGICIAYFLSANRGSPIMWALLIGASIQSVICILQTLNGGPLGLSALGEIRWEPSNLFLMGETEFRAYGLAIHPANLNAYLVTALFAGMHLQNDRWQGYSIAIICLLVIILIGIASTLARTAALAAFALSIPIFYQLMELHLPQRLQKSFRISPPIVAATIILTVLLVGIGYVISGGIRDRFIQLLITPEVILPRVLFAFEDTVPFLLENWRFGVGIRALMPEIANAVGTTERVLLPAHNLFVVVWTELGLLGFTLLLGGVMSSAWRSLMWKQSHQAIWGTAIIALAIFMLFDYFIWLDARSTNLLFIVLGSNWGCANKKV